MQLSDDAKWKLQLMGLCVLTIVTIYLDSETSRSKCRFMFCGSNLYFNPNSSVSVNIHIQTCLGMLEWWW